MTVLYAALVVTALLMVLDLLRRRALDASVRRHPASTGRAYLDALERMWLGRS